MPDLTCYKLRSQPDGPVQNFADAIDEKKLSSLQEFGPIGIGTVTAKLYLSASFPHPPSWGGFLRDGFGEQLQIPHISGASAILVVKLDHSGSTYFLAFTFGYGFALLRPDAYERGFGLRTSLNIIFEGDDGTDATDPARLRSVDSKRVGPTVLRSRHQVSGSTSLEELDVNVRRDLLNGVTGTPVDRKVWGTRITGRDALHLSLPVNFADLAHVCSRIADAYERNDYQVRFSFVDDMQLEKDPVVRARLEEEVLGLLQGEVLITFDLAPPDLIDWERVSGFRYHADPAKRKTPVIRRELRLSDYVSALKESGLLNELTVEKLKGYDIISVDGMGQPVERWSVWRCLFGELDIDGATYILDDGDFYSVSPDYLNQIDADLLAIDEWPGQLPDWITGTKERDYNELAASSSNRYILLDRKTVKVSQHTTQIEICDVLAQGGALIHVKRKSDGSSSLSHLFAQGFVSADLLVGSPEYRDIALRTIKKATKERAASSGDQSFIGRFETFSKTAVDPRKHTVVFAILGKWTGGLETLPFFSKVMLRQIADDLGRRNLKIAIKRVPAIYGQIPS